MVERTVRHFFLQFFVAQQQIFDVFGAVEMCAAAFFYAVNEYHMEYASVPVRVHGEFAKVCDLVGGAAECDFFLQFPQGGLFRRFALVDDSGGELQRDLSGAVAVLLCHDPFAFGGAGKQDAGQHGEGEVQRLSADSAGGVQG